MRRARSSVWNRPGLRPGRSAAVCATACAALRPHDWDLCTAAAAGGDACACLRGRTASLETGLKHGTLTLMLDGRSARNHDLPRGRRLFGRPSPGRRVALCAVSVRTSRGAISRSARWRGILQRGLFDPFEGQNDLKNRILRAVGDPDTRFTRRMRCAFCAAVRFAVRAWLFDRADNTAAAMRRQTRPPFLRCSRARARGADAACCAADWAQRTLLKYNDIIGAALPELRADVRLHTG